MRIRDIYKKKIHFMSDVKKIRVTYFFFLAQSNYILSISNMLLVLPKLRYKSNLNIVEFTAKYHPWIWRIVSMYVSRQKCQRVCFTKCQSLHHIFSKMLKNHENVNRYIYILCKTNRYIILIKFSMSSSY